MEDWGAVRDRLLAELERQATVSKYSGMDADIRAALERESKQADELSALRQAVGLATTCAPEMEMDSAHPVEMMREVCRVVAALRQRVEELERALAPLIPRHCGLCVPVDEQGRMGAVTTESCVCAPHHKQARAALAAERRE